MSQVVKYIPAVGRRWYCSRLIGLLEWYTMGWMIDNIPARWGTSGLFIRPASDCRLTFNVHVSFAFFQALNRPDPNVLRHVRGRDYGTKLPKQPASKHHYFVVTMLRVKFSLRDLKLLSSFSFARLLELVIQALACFLMPSLLVGTCQDIDVKD